MNAVRQKSILLLLVLLAVLVTFSLHPLIVEISRGAGILKGSILSRYIIVVFAVLFFLCFRIKETLQSSLIRTFLFMVFVVALFSLLTFGFFEDAELFDELRALFISWAALVIGWQLKLSDVQFRNVILVYAISTLFVGLMQVVTNVGGFVIEEQYVTDDKNVLGVIVATSVAVFAFLAVKKNTKKTHSILCWIIIAILFVIILTIRARTATLVAFFIVLLILYRRVEKSKLIIILILFPFLLVVGYFVLPSSVKEYVLSSFVLGYEGDLTSGRSARNQLALSFLSSHPFLGNLHHEAGSIGWIHNYPLLQLFNNGLMFGFPILTLYLYLFIKIIKNVFKCKVNSIREVGFFAMLVPYIISLAEPTFPFGPGTATVFNFILLGISIRYKWGSISLIENKRI